MTYTVVVMQKGAVDDIEAVRASVDQMKHGAWPDFIQFNPGYDVRISQFKSPPLALLSKGAVDDTDALRAELDKAIAIVEINPGYTIDFVER
jgi:hypothetical protein